MCSSRVEFRGPDDVLSLLPPLPSDAFSTRELAALFDCGVLLAQRAAYCLRMMDDRGGGAAGPQVGPLGK